MPQGDKSSYTDKQKRQAEHIEDGYQSRARLRCNYGGWIEGIGTR